MSDTALSRPGEPATDPESSARTRLATAKRRCATRSNGWRRCSKQQSVAKMKSAPLTTTSLSKRPRCAT
jgi:hypothetical protein